MPSTLLPPLSSPSLASGSTSTKTIPPAHGKSATPAGPRQGISRLSKLTNGDAQRLMAVMQDLAVRWAAVPTLDAASLLRAVQREQEGIRAGGPLYTLATPQQHDQASTLRREQEQSLRRQTPTSPIQAEVHSFALPFFLLMRVQCPVFRRCETRWGQRSPPWLYFLELTSIYSSFWLYVF